MSELDINEIVSELAKGRSHDQIVTSLCERSGQKWDDVSKLVRHVETNHAPEIAKKRFPFLVVFSSVIVLIGILLVGSSVYSLASGEKMPLTIDIYYYAQTFHEGGQLSRLGMVCLRSLLVRSVSIWHIMLPGIECKELQTRFMSKPTLPQSLPFHLR